LTSAGTLWAAPATGQYPTWTKVADNVTSFSPIGQGELSVAGNTLDNDGWYQTRTISVFVAVAHRRDESDGGDDGGDGEGDTFPSGEAQVFSSGGSSGGSFTPEVVGWSGYSDLTQTPGFLLQCIWVDPAEAIPFNGPQVGPAGSFSEIPLENPYERAIERGIGGGIYLALDISEQMLIGAEQIAKSWLSYWLTYETPAY
jgi:hypothetical protein